MSYLVYTIFCVFRAMCDVYVLFIVLCVDGCVSCVD